MTSSAAILAVGSELLSGQVTNRNAAWLSAKLQDLGIPVTRHLVVDDVEQEILDGLDTAAAAASILFVTGGLGPTSDDLTRQVIARWVGEELVYDPDSWDHITNLFARMSRTVPEANRQQCFFPQSAKVLTNNAGTANGFVLSGKGREIWVLPGPPIEIETIWKEHVDALLQNRVPLAERKRLRMWRTIGRGESHLAEIIEPLVQGQGVEVAYRAHAPFVELKLRFPEATADKYTPLCDRITTTLTPWLFESDGQNVAQELASKLAGYRTVDIYDGVSQGNLSELLAGPIRETLPGTTSLSFVTAWERHESPRQALEQWLASETNADMALGLAGFDAEGRWAIGIRLHGEKSVVERPSPYKWNAGEALRARNLKAIASLAAKAWLTLLSGSLH